MSHSSRLAVIGLGNLSRKDDAIGMLLVRELKQTPVAGVDYYEYGTSSIDLINKLSEYETALIIDGIDAGLDAGQLKIFKRPDILLTLKPKFSSTHELGLVELLDMTENFGLTTDIMIAGIQIQDVSHGDGLSAPIKTNFSIYIEKLQELIKTLFTDCQGKVIMSGS